MTRHKKGAPLHGEVRWERPELPPENREYTVSDIEKLADQFKDIKAEPHKIRRSFETLLACALANNRHQ
jgi:hypothetical protein